MKEKTGYSIMKEMLDIDTEIQSLNEKLKGSLSDKERQQVERQIDHLYSDFLEHKHRLDRLTEN